MTTPHGISRLTARTALITSADTYMGPAIIERLRAEGATIIADNGLYIDDPDEPARIISAAPPLDILVVNLMPREVKFEGAADVSEREWLKMYDGLVHPTMRFVKAVLPGMIKRRRGKIIVVTGAAPLRPADQLSSYAAARGAQNAYARAVGAEVARHNVQINAIAQNFVYGGYPRDWLDDAEHRETVQREIPAQRLAEGWEQAALVRFLASDESNFISGQVVPFTGGWSTSMLNLEGCQ